MEFSLAMQHLLRVEGGKVSNPHDNGGRTLNGVTQRTYDGWRTAHHLPLRDVWLMEPAERDAIYFHDYWLAGRCDLIAASSGRLALCHFDACVHHGVRKVKPGGRIVGANVMLQEVMGVTRDGWIGPTTLAAIDAVVAGHGEEELVQGYLALRRQRFAAIIAADPSQQVFAKGWNNRLTLLAEDADALPRAA